MPTTGRTDTKIWRYKYQDDVTVSYMDNNLGPLGIVNSKCVSARNHPGNESAFIVYDKNKTYCNIYTDKENKSLLLLAENVKVSPTISAKQIEP